MKGPTRTEVRRRVLKDLVIFLHRLAAAHSKGKMPLVAFELRLLADRLDEVGSHGSDSAVGALFGG